MLHEAHDKEINSIATKKSILFIPTTPSFVFYIEYRKIFTVHSISFKEHIVYNLTKRPSSIELDPK